jgi:hypothetical protein
MFSAHGEQDVALCVRDKLNAIMGNGRLAQIFPVPDAVGVFPLVSIPASSLSVDLQDAPLPAKPKPFRKVTQQEFQAETEAMVKAMDQPGDAHGDWTDASS